MTRQQAHTAIEVARMVGYAEWRRLGDRRLIQSADLASAALLNICLRQDNQDEAKGSWRGFCFLAGRSGARNYAEYIRGSGATNGKQQHVVADEDDGPLAALIDAAESPDRTDFAAEVSEVKAAVSRLPEPFADAVRNYYLHERSDTDFAHEVGLTPQSINLRRRSGIAYLRLALGVEPDARRRTALPGGVQTALKSIDRHIAAEAA